MRQAFCDGMVQRSDCSEFTFLTGDLGYRALEPLRAAMGSRFINAGIAEQNMVSVAAGLARQGLRPWIYSIAPFIYARPFEQVRNDICFHGLPVVLVGNGGGYGYGVMGSTHHALEDYGVLLTLPRMEIYIPAFDGDLDGIIATLFEASHPSYLRLGLGEQPQGFPTPSFSQWRKLTSGFGGTIIAIGPLAGAIWAACVEQPEVVRPNLWCLCQLPINGLPNELLHDLSASDRLVIAEEHVSQGSAGQAIAMLLLKYRIQTPHLHHATAQGYPSGRYGSQSFHRVECGLDAASLLTVLRSFPQ